MTFVTILGAMALSASTPAQADTVRAEVSYADLNLISAADRATLETRVARAARRICGDATSIDLRSAMAARRCRVSAHANARPQIELAIARTQNAVRVAAR